MIIKSNASPDIYSCRLYLIHSSKEKKDKKAAEREQTQKSKKQSITCD